MSLIPIIDQQSNSTDHSFENLSDQNSEESFEIVQRKIRNKKCYQEEEPLKKKKDLCRNFQISGNCKYGDQCFFIHTPAKTENNIHALAYTKTKPCKRYFSGFCCYGPKCQFLHNQCIDLVEQREFVEKQFKELKLMVPLHPKKLDQSIRFDLQRFHHLYKIFGRKLNFKRDDLIVNSCKSRLKIFITICRKQDRFEQLLMSNSTSRKESEQS
ncbi:unnamed protein product [Paramecium sonneborni]|uniref:C3H1-type domain-containing protein n=1 Tax=Paramecium sonneborni TaxID=65129 RepID=A0A8S1MUG1_9CILI|nr:unnamed protein product [Paramecium sonneborni]